MAILSLTGNVIKILGKESGLSKSGKEWSKQDFCIETNDEKYSKKVCFTLFGDNSDMITSKKVGDLVEVKFNAESREWKDRWFTSLTAYSVNLVGGSNESGSDLGNNTTGCGKSFSRVEDAKIEETGSLNPVEGDLPF